jgi:UDP-glucose:(heptosyl)LPS alpha-1,3-glucosyltransferase
VRFAGAVADVERYYAAADLFALPTRFDPFANATLEAMASGLPVITSAQNGAAEVLTSGIDGLVLQRADDPAALAAAIRSLASEERRRAMGARARATALVHPWEGQIQATLEVYARVTDSAAVG